MSNAEVCHVMSQHYLSKRKHAFLRCFCFPNSLRDNSCISAQTSRNKVISPCAGQVPSTAERNRDIDGYEIVTPTQKLRTRKTSPSVPRRLLVQRHGTRHTKATRAFSFPHMGNRAIGAPCIKVASTSRSTLWVALPFLESEDDRPRLATCGRGRCLCSRFRDSSGPTPTIQRQGRTMTMTMTMTHSKKSHIRRMKAWPYRQECRGHDPTKKNLFY